MLKRKGWDGIGVYEETGQWLGVFKGSEKILLRSEPCRYLEEKGQLKQKPWGWYTGMKYTVLSQSNAK